MNLIEDMVEKAQLVQRPAMKSGDTVRVHVKVREGDKERIQVFEGMVIGMHRGGVRASFTVRKVSFGQGVERGGESDRHRRRDHRHSFDRAARCRNDYSVGEEDRSLRHRSRGNSFRRVRC